jgi:hypothetical protein
MVSIQEIDESEYDGRFSRFKSLKKVGTIKNIAGGRKAPKTTKDHNFRAEPLTQTYPKATVPGGRLRKRKNHDTRAMNLGKKSACQPRMNLEIAMDEIFNSDHTWASRRSHIILFLKSVRDRGLLNSERHQHLRDKVEELLQKSSADEVERSRKHAQQV